MISVCLLNGGPLNQFPFSIPKNLMQLLLNGALCTNSSWMISRLQGKIPCCFSGHQEFLSRTAFLSLSLCSPKIAKVQASSSFVLEGRVKKAKWVHFPLNFGEKSIVLFVRSCIINSILDGILPARHSLLHPRDCISLLDAFSFAACIRNRVEMEFKHLLPFSLNGQRERETLGRDDML